MALSLVATTTGGMIAAPPAAALTSITVTTTDDVIDGSDGLVSLREAVDIANTTNDDTTIVLATNATYALSLCDTEGTGLAANATGDLDLVRNDSGAYLVTIHGNGATIDQTCLDQPHVDDHRPGPVSTFVLSDVTLTGAVVNGDATAVVTEAALTLDGATISDNDSMWRDQHSTAVLARGSGALTVTDSTIANTEQGAAIVDEGDTGAFTITNSSITGNGGNGEVAAISAFSRPLTITNSVVTDNYDPDTNIPTGPGTDPDIGNVESEFGAIAGDDITLIGVDVERNAAAYGGGLYARIARISDSSFVHNGAFLGGGAHVGWAEISDSSFIENSGGLLGGGLHLQPCAGGGCPSVATSITSTTFDGNLASSGGGLSMEPHTAPGHTGLDIDRSTFSRNRSYGGAGIQLDEVTTPVTIEASTIAGNLPGVFLGPISSEPQAELATTVYSGPGLTPLSISSSVVAATEPGMNGCVWESGVPVSGGHNFASDGSCGFGDGTDVNSGGDPLLGALADNAGDTDTMLPAAGSPLIDAIPSATPGCAGATAQNALALPQGLGCDIGAAERPSSAVLAGHVTSTHDGTPLAGIEVRVRTATNTYAAAATTAPDGTWTVTGLPAGTYKVLFRDPAGDYQQTFNGNAKQFATAPAIATTATNTTVVDQPLTAANTLTGTITDSVTGDPIPGAEARLRNAADNTFVATAKANGAGVYTFTNLVPGTYKIAFRDPTGTHTQIFNGSAPGFAAAPPIPIAPGDTLTIDQAMDPVPTIGGTITDSVSGLPLAGIDIRVRDLTNNYVAGATTAPNGTWTIHLAPGTYKLWFTDPTGDHLAEWHLDKPGFATATPITHTTAQTIDATLTPTSSVSPAP